MLNQNRKYLWLALVTSALILSACGGAAATAAPAATAALDQNVTQAPVGAEVSFSKDVLPVIQNRCVSCHGGDRTSKGLDMKTYESIIAGSENGPVLTAGDAANSLVVQLVAAGKMPKRGTKMTQPEIQMLTDWINAGAKNN
jgi:uncharacterized membrane protein